MSSGRKWSARRPDDREKEPRRSRAGRRVGSEQRSISCGLQRGRVFSTGTCILSLRASMIVSQVDRDMSVNCFPVHPSIAAVPVPADSQRGWVRRGSIWMEPADARAVGWGDTIQMPDLPVRLGSQSGVCYTMKFELRRVAVSRSQRTTTTQQHSDGSQKSRT